MASTVPMFRFTEKFNTDDIIRCHLYFSCIKKGIIPEKGELELLLYLYHFGIIDSKEKNKEFLKSSVEKEIRKSEASARNVLSKYTLLDVLVKEGNSKRKFHPDIISYGIDSSNPAVFQYFITNFDIHAN